MITVITVILGGYDNLRPPAVIEPGVRYVCFADEPVQCPGWEIQPCPRLFWDKRDSRIPKILPHLWLDTQYSIYHDGCFSITRKPSELIREHLNGADLCMYQHPRESVYRELEFCRQSGIGYGPAMEAQVERYRGHGLGNELYCGGVVIRKHTPIVQLFNEIWWREWVHGCSRDQFALAFARYSVCLKVNTINADILTDAGRFQFNFHADWTELGENPQFEEQRKKRKERWDRLRELSA